MNRALVCCWIAAVALTFRAASSAAEEPHRKPDPQPRPGAAQAAAPAQSPPGADYMIVFWYQRRYPIKTFRFRAYDVRKGQYTTKVTDWLEMVAAHYPRYDAFVRPVWLANEQGASEQEKVRTVAKRELLATAIYLGVPLYGLTSPSFSLLAEGLPMPYSTGSYRRYFGPSYRALPAVPQVSALPPLGPSPRFGNAIAPSSGATPSPFPYPYVRPHP